VDALKAAGSVIGGLTILAALLFLGGVFILGAEMVSEKALPFFETATVLAIVFCAIILLPLSIFRATRIVSVWGFFIASYLFGVYTWMVSFLVTFSLWGAGGVIVGLSLAGVGIFPLAIIASATHALWSTAGDIIFAITITYGARLFSFYLATTFDRSEAKGSTIRRSLGWVAALIIVGVLFTITHNIIALVVNQTDSGYLNIAGAPVDKALNVTIDKDVHFTATSGWTIYLNGIIDADAAKRFEDYVTNNHVPPTSLVIIDSSGGNLMQGIELGKSIRAHDFLTDVGRQNSSPPKPFDYTTGECYSACTLAYVGGHFRFLKDGSRFGIHRFSSPDPTQGNEDIAQITSATIVDYLKSMDIDTDFFSLSTQASPEDILEPTLSVLQKLRVVNGGFDEPKWTVESYNGSVYLKGERNTVYGINKFILACGDRSKVILYVIADPQGHDKEMFSFHAHSLVIDDQYLAHLHPITEEILNGWYNVRYVLTNEQIKIIRRAKTVGVVFQSSYGAPIFLGFNRMPFAEGAEKLDGLLKLCGVKH